MTDLALELPEAERYKRLLDALRVLLPSYAAAILKLEGEYLVPLAVNGLSHDTLGRRFRIAAHPRLERLLQATGPVRFPQDCSLSDPFDGLVDGVQGDLPVHDCMGSPLSFKGKTWGVLTLDSLELDAFDTDPLSTLQAFAGLASATVALVAHMRMLAARAEDEHQRAEIFAAASSPASTNRQLIGRCADHVRLMHEISVAGPSDLCVLVLGETGTGKELVAQALHVASSRAARPMVSINCAALPDSIAESELFGHVRGAFTGAVVDRRGKFDLADKGTLFLDEVGELPLAVQAKLLRVLQNGQLQRPGSDREHSVDVRIIAATNRDLADEVRKGRMRADFYHRLSVYPLHVAPLRERGRDVLMIAGYFLEEARSRLGLGGVRLDSAAQAELLGYNWPGNVRELEHLLGRAVVKALGGHSRRPRILTVGAKDLGLNSTDLQPPEGVTRPALPSVVVSADRHISLKEAVASLERRMILDALEANGQQWTTAARALGLDAANLARLARRLGIERTPGPGAKRYSKAEAGPKNS